MITNNKWIDPPTTYFIEVTQELINKQKHSNCHYMDKPRRIIHAAIRDKTNLRVGFRSGYIITLNPIISARKRNRTFKFPKSVHEFLCSPNDMKPFSFTLEEINHDNNS